jgi:hypothetical protein
MGDQWPWEARELDPRVPFNESAFPRHRTGIWLLKTSIIGNYCISCHGKQFSTLMGDLTCLGQKFYNDIAQETQWWGTPHHTEPQPHLLANFSNLKTASIILPCFLPLVMRSIRSIMEATKERKTAAHVMMLWKYKPLNQENDL